MANNFMNILSGFTKGASETVTKQNEESRKRKFDTDQLLGTTLLKGAEDPNLLPEEALAHVQEGLKRLGVKDKDAAPMLEGYRYLRLQHDEQNRSAPGKAPGQPQGTSKPLAPAPELGDVPTRPIAAPAMPEMNHGQAVNGVDYSEPPQTFQTESVASKPLAPAPQVEAPTLGEVPSQQRTVGEIDFERNLPMDTKKAQALAQVQRDAQRAMTIGEIEDKVDLFKKKIGRDPDENEMRQLLNMAPKSSTGASTFLPGQGMRGEDVIRTYPDHPDVMAGHIVPGKLYNISVGPDKKTPIGFFPREEQTSGSGKEMSGAQATAMGITSDMGGAPVNNNGTYTFIRSVSGGRIIGVVPTTQLATFLTSNTHLVATDGDGNIVSVPVTNTSTSQKGLSGGGGALGNVPSMPVGVTPQATGAPSTGAPGATGTSGGTNPTPGMPGSPKGSKIIGARPTTIPEATVAKINSAQDTISQTEKLMTTLPDVENYLGPIAGQLTGLSLNHLGGLFLPEHVVTFVTTVRQLIADKAFEKGGKTLPMGEQKIYTAHLPAETDTPATLVTKLKVFLPLFKKDYENQLRGLTGNQRRQLTGGGLGNVPAPATPAAGGFKAGDTRVVDGTTYVRDNAGKWNPR